MKVKFTIRCETDADVSAINEVTVAAFKTLEISNHTEQFIIEALRAAKALRLSLVAEMEGRVIGHIAFSPVTLSDGTRDWYGLGPVSVLPAYQRQGTGKALIREGLLRLKDMNAQGCCLVGHPDYYRKFGFENIPGLIHEGVPPEIFFALSFDGHTPKGTVAFHDGFKAEGSPSPLSASAGAKEKRRRNCQVVHTIPNTFMNQRSKNCSQNCSSPPFYKERNSASFLPPSRQGKISQRLCQVNCELVGNWL
jgi:putative acetyltransferase